MFFFFRLPSNALPDIGSVGRIEKKKTFKKNVISILGIGGLVPQHHSCGARKTTRRENQNQYGGKVGGCCFKINSELRQRGKKDQPPKPLCDIKWLKKRRYLFFFFFFFGKCPKFGSVGRRETAAGEKKRDGLNVEISISQCYTNQIWQTNSSKSGGASYLPNIFSWWILLGTFCKQPSEIHFKINRIIFAE